jgi:DNA-binding CsgD family transcriptional regulator
VSTSAAHGSPRRSPTTARDLAERPAGADGVARGPSGEVEPTDDDLEQAARQLLDLARRLPRPRVKDAVLVDVVLDGARCVVTCSSDPRAAAGAPAAAGAATALSPREQEIARMVATGCTNKEIASVLEISSWTVSTHLRRIFGKLDVSTRAAMVARLVLSDGRP